MLHFPAFNPVMISIGPLQLHWYGLMYLIGFAAVWLLAFYRIKKNYIALSKEQLSDIVFYGAVGAVIGGRVFYTFIYNAAVFLQDPLVLFKVWQGGMSFHGGFVGVVLALWWYGKRHQLPLFALTDFIAPFIPIGLGAGRLGNFINGELWGRVTTLPWGIIYPQAGDRPRHPSELYEFLLEGVLLFIILWCYSLKPRPRMAVSALFLMLYGFFRYFAEFFRAPDPQLGFVLLHSITMGQVLSLPMIFLGAILWIAAHRVKS